MNSTTRRMARLLASVVTIITLAALSPASSSLLGPGLAGAEDSQVIVSPGLDTTGATSTDADGATHTYSASESAAMMQPLLTTMYYGKPNFVEPPVGAARSTITYSYVFTVDDPDTVGTFTLNYLHQGNSGWISFPVQSLWPGSAITPDLADRWFTASPSFVAAYDGQGTVQTFPTTNGTSAKTSSSSISGVLIVLVVVIAVAVLGGVFAITRRRRASAS
jgi:hypothetical protein